MIRPAPDEFDQTLVSLDRGELLSGRYRLVRELGRGGMGVVWLAEDTTLDDRTVAIKLLPTILSGNARAIGRLKKEATTSLELSHPHIVRLLNFEQDAAHGDLAYLVMQYVQGQTLDDLLADHPDGLPVGRVLKWAEQIAGALDYAHYKGVLHRDIKPSNIMIDGNDNAYLMDFGIAREAKDTMTRFTGRDSSGTLPYMSPQQVDGKNHKSNDIYSFSATLYEALKGEPPFTTGDLINQIKHIPVSPIKSQAKLVNDGLLAAMSKQASDRPVTAHDLFVSLQRHPFRCGEAPEREAATSKSSPVRSSAGPRRRSPLAALIVALLLTGIPAIGFVGWQSGWFRHSQVAPPRVSVESPRTPKTRPRPINSNKEPKPGDHKTLDLGGGVKMEFIFIGPGEFTMGSPPNEVGRGDNEGPQHKVTIAKGFWLAETEVTQAQYQALIGKNPSDFKGDQNPVENVSWDDAQSFCVKLSQKAGVSARLPSEAEWEYACRAGTTTPFSTGNTISTDQANYDGNYTYGSGRKGVYREKTMPVKSFAANPWGLYDMHGNVYEWCEDVCHDNYNNGAPTDGSAWMTGGDQSVRVLRGGSWGYMPLLLRSASRGRNSSGFRSIRFGFRPALDSN